jgi:SAM-dependent methyltransferase
MTDPRSAARDYWLDRTSTLAGPRAVHPDTRWLGYDLWTRRLLQRWTLARLGGRRFRHCVDLGCGYGDWTAQFAARADAIDACDLAPAFVAETRRRLAAHSAARVDCADLREWPLPRGFDFAYVGAVLMYLPDRDAGDVLRRIRKAASPGALVVVRDFCAFGRGRRTVDTRDGGYVVYRRGRELVQLAETAGLTAVELRASPRMYADVMAHGNRVAGWALRVAWRLATLTWSRASHTLIARA